MIRIVFLSFVLLSGQARGQPSGDGFDADAMLAVQTEAIEFVLPRSLEAVTASELAMWGLAGLTTIDPALSVSSRDTKI